MEGASMASDTLNVHYNATTAVDSLKEPYRQRLIEAVHRLENTAEANWPAAEVTRLRAPEALYVLRLPPYRVFLTRTEDHGLQVRDIVHEETLRLWFNGTDKQGGSADEAAGIGPL
jgi:hypothetical protein